MLEGFDRDWTDAGARRLCLLQPTFLRGAYTFRVQAANNDGLWNTSGAALTFELRPHYYQTAWFLVLLLWRRRVWWSAVALRLRRAEGDFAPCWVSAIALRARFTIRWQWLRRHQRAVGGVGGVAAAEKPEEASKHLDLTRGYVREGLADARQSIWGRCLSRDSGETTLPVACAE